jgi:hypothetical protein
LNHRYNSWPIHKRGKQLLEKGDQHPKGSTQAGKERRKSAEGIVTNPAGNFRSTPYQMGDNPTGEPTQIAAQTPGENSDWE